MARGPSRRKLDEADEQIRRWRGNHKSLRKYHELMKLEYKYNLKLNHHDRPDPGRPLARTQQLTISTLDLYDSTQTAAAQISGIPPYLDVRPAEPGRDDSEQQQLDDAAIAVRGVMEEQFHDIDLGYPRVRRAVVRMGQAARVGAAALDVVPGGPHGADIVPRVVDPWNISWDTRFMHPNAHGNRVLWEVVPRVPLEDIHEDPAYGPNRKLVKRDDGKQAFEAQEIPDAEPMVDHDSDEDNEPTATLVVGWLMDDPEEVDVQVGEPTKLDPSNYYMACSKCGYAERDLAQDPGYDGSTLPEMMPCPQCGSTPEGRPVSQAVRIETERAMGKAPAYENSNRRIVFAPLSPEAGLLKDGPWPKGLTRFPLMYHVSDPFPLEPSGNSKTFLQMDLQSLKNATVVEGFLQMERNKDLTLAKEDSLWTADHQPYQFDGSGDRIAYVSTYDDLQGIKHIQGSGLNAAFGLWFQTVDNELNRHRGSVQQLAPEQMKGVQVGTIARSQETGNIPQNETLDIFREDEEGFANRWLELLSGAWNSSAWVEAAGPEGDVAFRLFHTADAGKMRLKIHAAPDLNAVDREQLKAASELSAIQSPTLLRFAAQSAKLPRHVVEGMVQELQERTAAMRPPSPANIGLPPGSPPGMGAPQGQPGLPAMPEPAVAAMS